MRLYLNGWEADLVEQVLKEAYATRPSDNAKIRKLLFRMERCKSLQRPHITHLTSLDGDQTKH